MPNPPESAVLEALPCPGCGFDLRGTPGDRCGECGQLFDRAALAESGFPWAHRAKIGRIRAYLRTVWWVTWRSSRLAYETARPQDSRDARKFARITAAIIALALLTGFGLVAWDMESLDFLSIVEQSPRGGVISSPPELDFTLPWSAGATLWPVIPIGLIALAIYLTGMPRSVLVRKSFDPVQAERAVAISFYTTAPLALLLPAVLLMIAIWPIIHYSIFLNSSPFSKIALVIMLGAQILAAISLVMTLVRIGQWCMRIWYCGFGGVVLGLAYFLALTAVGFLALFGLFPWCVGFLWIVIDSLR